MEKMIMNKRFLKTLIAIGSAIMLIMLFVTCSNKDNKSFMANNAIDEGAQDDGMPGRMPGATDSPGGPPGGPGGPGGEMAAESIISAAETQFFDFDSVKNKDAVKTVFDLGLMDESPCDDGSLCFRPKSDLTFAELAKAVSMATLLVRGGTPSDFISYCTDKGLFKGAPDPDKTVTGYDAARILLSALGIRGVTEDDCGVVDVAFKRYNLTEGLGDINLSQIISRDNAAQMIANALRLSDGSAYIPKVLYNSPIRISSGAMTVDNTRIFNYGGSAVENSGESVIVVRNSRVDGDTSVATRPLAGNPAGLLIAGSIRTTLALNRAQAFYINSEVISKDWAALSTDGARPVTEPGQTELSVYAYGSSTETTEGGYGTYSDLFCNVYLYGTKMDSAEIGIVSGTYGSVTVGTIGDGEASDILAAHLIAADREARSDKSAGSVVTGGRNAVMIHSVNLPPYWVYKGYSQEELPLYSAKISVHGSTLATDLSLGKNVKYPAERQAYIDHHNGSVILIKSSNADIVLDKTKITADKKGTGALIHTVINNDSEVMMNVPDGANYPGVKVMMTDMDAEGDILNEDYQRDMYISLTGTSLTGKIVSGMVGEWYNLCREKGFETYIIDSDGYKTIHGVNLTLNSGSVWNVTGESKLTALTINDGTIIKAPAGKKLTIKVNGAPVALAPGSYKGNIVINFY